MAAPGSRELLLGHKPPESQVPSALPQKWAVYGALLHEIVLLMSAFEAEGKSVHSRERF